MEETGTQRLLRTTPTGVLLLITSCVVVFAMTSTGLVNINSGSMIPALVLEKGQIYRIFTSPFIHLNLVHICMNMLTLYAVGVNIDRKFGTTYFLGIILLFVLVSNIVYTIAASIAMYLFDWFLIFIIGVAGFSGVLFGLVVVNTRLSGAETQSIFGFFTVPAWLYPWILLVLLQVLLPGVSFLGHLCGIVSGVLFSHGVFNCIAISRQRILRFEETYKMTLDNIPGFVPCPQYDAMDYGYHVPSMASLLQHVRPSSSQSTSVQHQAMPQTGGQRLGGPSVFDTDDSDHFSDLESP